MDDRAERLYYGDEEQEGLTKRVGKRLIQQMTQRGWRIKDLVEGLRRWPSMPSQSLLCFVSYVRSGYGWIYPDPNISNPDYRSSSPEKRLYRIAVVLWEAEIPETDPVIRELREIYPDSPTFVYPPERAPEMMKREKQLEFRLVRKKYQRESGGSGI